jgi:serine protease
MTSSSRARRAAAIATACAALLLGAGAADAHAALSAAVAGEVVVGYVPGDAAAARAGGPAAAPQPHVLHVPAGRVRATIARLRRQPGVAYAVPNVIAHASASPAPLPDDPGIAGFPGGLAALQWNFFGAAGVNALQAWGNVAAAGHPGGRGVRIAVLDTGVAYRNLGSFRKSPDFAGTRFVAPYDFLTRTPFPVDRNPDGHGTHVAGTIAEATNDGLGVTGLAWGATIIPVRVLDGHGYGDAATIAQGIRYAVRHGARVVNLSLEFSSGVQPSEIPEVLSAIRYATRHGAVIVAASGNEGEASVAYPARDAPVVSVGATTDDGCLADFSNDGAGLDLVAPGGGADAGLTQDPDCHAGRQGADVYQMTYTHPFAGFGLPPGFEGTSMATPHVSATAALVIAGGVLGRHPTPAQVVCRLKATARPLGLPGPNRVYGAGLLDAGAATSPDVHTPQCLLP